MATVSLVPAASATGLACPYCGRVIPVDERGMFAAQASWGFCGAVASEVGRVVGVLTISAQADPAADLPIPTAMISSVWVTPGLVGRGLGRQLVQTVAGGLVRQRVGSLLAVAGGRNCCRPPKRWLGAVGFAPTRQAHVWRLDLGQTITTTQVLRSALERLVDSVRPLPPPEPVGRTET